MVPTHDVRGPSDAPLLVLGGSLGCTSDMWAPQMPALTERFRVVRYEHRGHDGSAAPTGPYTMAGLGQDVVDLLDALGAERASLCGLSLGGMVAMWVAAHHPDRVDRLVLACTAARLPPPDAWEERAAMVRTRGVMSLLDVLLQRWFSRDHLEANPDVLTHMRAMLGAVDDEGYAGCCEAIANADLRLDLARISAPTLVVAGADDPVTPPASALALHEGIEGSALAVIPRASHLANIQQPGAFTQAVIEHLAGAPLARGEAVRRAVLGDAHVDSSAASATDFDRPFLDLITGYAWGEVWTRPGLDRAMRSCITIAMLVALGRFDEMPMHVHGALRNGLSPDEIREVLLQTAIYCGAPAANSAFAAARTALAANPP